MALLNLQKPVSPAYCPLDGPAPPAQKLDLCDEATYCDGTYCKLANRVIPQHWQRYEIELAGKTLIYCYLCLRALDGDDPRHVCGNNRTFANGL